jgi:signal transduction histidine kinase
VVPGDTGNATGTRAIVEMARAVLSELDLEVVLHRVLESARELTGARYGALGVLDERKQRLERFLTVGIDEAARHAIGPLPTGRGVLGELIDHPEPLRLADVGSHPHSYGFPPGHPRMTTFLGVPIEVAGEPYGNLYLTDKDGGAEFSEDDQEAVCRLGELAGIAIDHARRYTRSEDQRTELERTVEALDATIQIARALGGETDLEAMLELVAKRGRALVSARALVIESVEGSELTVSAAAGELPGDLLGQRMRLDETVAEAAIRSLRTQRLDEALNRRRFERHGLGRFGYEARTGLAVPLVFRGRAYGVMLALDHLGEEGFTAQDCRLLEAFASSAATAVATATTAAAERQRQRLAAAEQERGRWARELHDETLQGLAALRLRLQTAARADDLGDVKSAIHGALDQLDAEIAGLRSLVTELRPAALDQLGVQAAIEALAKRAHAAGMDVDLHIDLAYERDRSRERHDDELETAIYRIVQEALNNAARHGGARRAIVEIVEDEDRIALTVRDDGNGFDPDAGTDGFGLLGMRERAELLSGELEIASGPGGTTIRANLPERRRRGLSVGGDAGA